MKYLSLLSLAALFFLTSCGKSGSESAADPKADSMKTAYRALTQAWDDGKQDEFDKYMAADYKAHNAMPGYDGLEGAKKMSRELKVGFPDMKTNIEDIRVDGDIVMVRSRMTGTNSGSMMGGPATNKKMDVIGLEMARWHNGKFVESWFAMEEMKMMEQLGMMPPMGAPPTDSTKKPL